MVNVALGLMELVKFFGNQHIKFSKATTTLVNSMELQREKAALFT